jgi:hypothetical protein
MGNLTLQEMVWQAFHSAAGGNTLLLAFIVLFSFAFIMWRLRLPMPAVAIGATVLLYALASAFGSTYWILLGLWVMLIMTFFALMWLKLGQQVR